MASRGIDVEALGHVVNYDVPGAPEDYIHRIGRTGRAEAKGNAHTFVSLQEEADVRNIERVLRRKLPRIRVPGFDHGAVSWGTKAGGNGGSNGHGRTRGNVPQNGNGRPSGNGAAGNGAGRPAQAPRTTRLGARRGRNRSGRR